MAGIFDEAYMRSVLGRCTPAGEALAAGVHAVTLQVNKKKASRFDVYVGVTERYLLVAECEERAYLTQVYGVRIRDTRKAVDEELGVCFLFSDIARCRIDKGLLGAVNCSLTFQNGDFLKLQIPKRAGIGGGIPRQAEDREEILSRLRALG